VFVHDIDEQRVRNLAEGHTPFLEPHLTELIRTGRESGRLSFHDVPADAFESADVVFICVNTPGVEGGSVDLSAVLSATRAVARSAKDDAVVVNRSTAPVGSAEYVRSLIREERGRSLHVAVNPEFLAEGTAVRDFLVPDRIVVGAWTDRAFSLVLEAYGPILARRLPREIPLEIREDAAELTSPVPVVTTTPSSAELAKYAANAFLAVKISFVNEIAGISEEVGANVDHVAHAIGLDHRIGPHFLRAGIGWGGSCFPKDILALQGMAETRGLAARMLRAANEVNHEQLQWVVRTLQRHLRTLVGRRIGLLGLSFKPHTDDLRSAPSIEIAAVLDRLGARVHAYDPAIHSLPPGLAHFIHLVQSPIELAKGLEALVLVTEWPQFGGLDLGAVRREMRLPLLVDGRNLFDPEAARAAGFVYVSVGRPVDPVLLPDRPADSPEWRVEGVEDALAGAAGGESSDAVGSAHRH
jgi:UDPglucose 6-dehydrogenase